MPLALSTKVRSQPDRGQRVPLQGLVLLKGRDAGIPDPVTDCRTTRLVHYF